MTTTADDLHQYKLRMTEIRNEMKKLRAEERRLDGAIQEIGGETMIFTQQITRGYDDAELERMNAEWARIVEAENLTPTTDAYYTRQDQFIDAVNHFSPRDVKNVRRPLRARDIPDDAQTYPE